MIFNRLAKFILTISSYSYVYIMEAADTNEHNVETSDARDFVDSVMGSQRIVRVDTPVASGTKRHASVPSATVSESIVKKPRVTVKSRRNLYSGESQEDSPPVQRTVIVTEADVHASSSPTVEQLLSKIAADMKMMFSSLEERMDKLDSSLESRSYFK